MANPILLLALAGGAYYFYNEDKKKKSLAKAAADAAAKQKTPYTAQQLCTRMVELSMQWGDTAAEDQAWMQQCIASFVDVERLWSAMTAAQRAATTSMMNCAMNPNVTKEEYQSCLDTWLIAMGGDPNDFVPPEEEPLTPEDWA